MTPTKNLPRLGAIALAIALATGLAACNKNDDRTAGQKLDAGIAKTEQAAQDAQAKAAEAARDAKDAASTAAADAKDAASTAAADTKAAAKEAGAEIRQEAREVKAEVSAAAERVGDLASDAATTASIKTKLLADSELSGLQINVDTKDHVVTLTGPAPDASAKARAETIALAVSGVKSVHNNLTVN